MDEKTTLFRVSNNGEQADDDDGMLDVINIE